MKATITAGSWHIGNQSFPNGAVVEGELAEKAIEAGAAVEGVAKPEPAEGDKPTEKAPEKPAAKSKGKK